MKKVQKVKRKKEGKIFKTLNRYEAGCPLNEIGQHRQMYLCWSRFFE